MAVLDLGARLVTFTVTALAGSFRVNGHLLVDSLGCLSERQLHDVLCRENNTQIVGTAYVNTFCLKK